jgi:hypothetical protein
MGRILRGLTLALAVGIALAFVYAGVTGAVSEARDRDGLWLVFEIGVVGLFGGMLLVWGLRVFHSRR